jgi:hypothetical protein
MAMTILKDIFADMFFHGVTIFTAARHFRHCRSPRQIDNPTAAFMRKLVRSPGEGTKPKGAKPCPHASVLYGPDTFEIQHPFLRISVRGCAGKVAVRSLLHQEHVNSSRPAHPAEQRPGLVAWAWGAMKRAGQNGVKVL